ncbi:MAG: hypothetical protein ACE5HP_11610 [Gemmatimonadota bacterium]
MPGGRERWASFDAEGRLQATLELPAGSQALRFGVGYVLGVTRDVLRVEHVRMYRLARAAGEERE